MRAVRFKPTITKQPSLRIGKNVVGGTEYDEMEFTGFAGLNNKYSNIEVDDNEATDLLNVEFDAVGAIVKRKGYTSKISLSNPITSIIPYYRSDGTRVSILTAGQNVYSYDPVSGSQSTIKTSLHANGARFNGAVYYDKLYLCNGDTTDGLMSWDGTSFLHVSGGPNGQYVAEYKNRVYVAGDPSNKNRLYMSDLGNGDSWPVANFIDIDTNDGDHITSIHAFGDSVVIFKETSMHVLKGSDPSNYAIVDVMTNVGTVSHWSVKEIPGGLLFLGKDGIYSFDGKKVALISDKIQGSVDAWNESQLNNAVAFVYDHKYWLSVPEGTGQTANNYTYVFSYLYGWWTRHNLSMAAALTFVGTNEKQTPYFSDTANNLYQADYGDNDNGSSIDAYLVTKAYDFGSTAHFKTFKQVFMTALAEAGNYDLKMTFILDFGYTSKMITLPLSYTNPTIWDQFKWGQAPWGGNGEVVHASTSVPGQAKYLQFKVEGLGNNAPFTFLSWVVRFKTKRRMA